MNNLFTLGKKITLSVVILLSSVVFSYSQIIFEQSTWSEIVKKAKNENKLIFIEVFDFSLACRWMSLNVYLDKKVGDFFNQNFICMKLDIEEKKNILGKLNIKETPTFIFYDPINESAYYGGGTKTSEQLLNISKKAINLLKIDVVAKKMIAHKNSGKIANFKIPNNDGRYTLGVKGQRLMYGYPYPNSTSHFVIKTDDKYASNSPRFQIGSSLSYFEFRKRNFLTKIFSIFKKKKKKKFSIRSYKDVKYLTDTLHVGFDKANALNTKIKYRFNGLEITQTLKPLNKELKPPKKGEQIRYYKIEYEIINKSNVKIETGFLALFDTMIDDNDAAKMDVFYNADVKKTFSKFRKRGVQKKYTKRKMPARILVYRDNKKLTKALTGDFHLPTKPDELHIGSWPIYYSVLWKIKKKGINKKYWDSAILMKWYEKILNPNEKLNYSINYGIFNKGSLELIPAGTKLTGLTKKGVPISFEKAKFTISPDTIYEGDTAKITWNTKNPLKAKIYISATNSKKLKNKGEILVTPKRSILYTMQMLENSKQIAFLKAKLVVLKRPFTKSTVEYEKLDGRFSIGVDNQPIMYGHPFPYSTSFFCAEINNKMVSNSDFVSNAIYLSANKEIDKVIKNGYELVYFYDSVKIIQRLFPVNSRFRRTDISKAKYFKIEYVVYNNSKKTKNIKFNFLLDTELNKKAGSTVYINKKEINSNTIINKNNLPKKIIVKNKYAKKSAYISLSNNGIKPEKIWIGQWQQIKQINNIKDFDKEDIKFEDEAFLFDWKKEKISTNDSLKYGFYIGASKVPNMNFVKFNVEQTTQLTIHYEPADSLFSNSIKNKIKAFVKGNDYDYILIEGFTDNKGDMQYNFDLAKRRINNVEKLLIDKFNIPDKIIINKVHGEVYANMESKIDKEDENQRKVIINLLKKPDYVNFK